MAPAAPITRAEPPSPIHDRSADAAVQVSETPTIDIATDYDEFGGGVNPLGYKGHVFHLHGYGINSIQEPATPVSFKFSSARRPQLPTYDFGDDDEDVLSITPPPQPPSRSTQQPTDVDFVASFIGPFFPFLGDVCLTQVGTSFFVGHTPYLLWRTSLALLAIAALVFTAVENLWRLTHISGAAVILSVGCQILLLRRAFLYRALRQDQPALVEKNDTFAWDPFIFQAALHLCTMTGPALWLSSFFTIYEDDVRTKLRYFGGVDGYMLFAITALHVIDIFVLPVPFRASFILPVVLCIIAISAATMWRAAREFSGTALVLIALTATVVGFLLHVLGRAIYVLRHERHVIPQRPIELVENHTHALKA